MTAVSTHVLDTAVGAPAAGVPVTLLRAHDGGWQRVGHAVTDEDGRVGDLPAVSDGLHRLVFVTGTPFFPSVTVEFVAGGEEHLHVPLLLSPYGYSVYRGS